MKTSNLAAGCALAIAALTVGCKDSDTNDAGEPDATVSRDAAPDAGVRDSSAPDLGTNLADATTIDGSSPDTSLPDAEAADVPVPEDAGPADAGVEAEFSANVYDEDGNGQTATVTIMVPNRVDEILIAPGGFFSVDLPVREPIFIKAELPDHMPLIRGVWLSESGAGRDFYLQRQVTIDGVLAALGQTQGADKGAFYIEFRNAPIGGYSATISADHGAGLTFFDSPKTGWTPTLTSSTTIQGGSNNFFYLLNVEPGMTTVSPASPPEGHTCEVRDPVPEWKVEPGVITQFDFECN